MTTGIYKITNKVNGKCYIGQSIKIEKRWSDHKIASHNQNDKGYNYPLYKAFRKYGIDNFDFEIIEECNINQLDEKEVYWIKYYNPAYNQTQGESNYGYSIRGKLTEQQVQEIKKILAEDIEEKLTYTDIGNMYNVHKDTIRDINLGYSWKEDNTIYPIRISRFDHFNKKPIKYYCKDCGKEVSKGAVRCKTCSDKLRKEKAQHNKPVTREELKKLIRTQSFLSIGKQFGVSDNSIRKWCDTYNLPRKKTEIMKYSDEEWEKI